MEKPRSIVRYIIARFDRICSAASASSSIGAAPCFPANEKSRFTDFLPSPSAQAQILFCVCKLGMQVIVCAPLPDLNSLRDSNMLSIDALHCRHPHFIFAFLSQHSIEQEAPAWQPPPPALPCPARAHRQFPLCPATPTPTAAADNNNDVSVEEIENAPAADPIRIRPSAHAW